jgi:hypothetical protein
MGSQTTTYTAQIGQDRIAWLTAAGSAIGNAGVLDHVASADDPATFVFDDHVAAVLRDLSDDSDGHLADGQLWFGGMGYPVETSSHSPAQDLDP